MKKISESGKMVLVSGELGLYIVIDKVEILGISVNYPPFRPPSFLPNGVEAKCRVWLDFERGD
jgi:hypothetical protein